MSQQGTGKRERSPRIAILGAGPAGLAAGYFLKRYGYKDVMIFEKLGRVGGLCKSVTDGYMAFDLGGTYVTPAYHETLKIARTVRAERYRGKRYEMVKVVKDDKGVKGLVKDDVWNYARYGLDRSQKPLGILHMARCVFRFWWQRRKVRSFVDDPTFDRVHGCPSLCVSFLEWLEQNGLQDIARLFEIPVTMMGYGFLKDVPAPYVLKYMAPGTYWSMFLRGIPFFGFFWAWPQRFREGFQRMWERVSWGLNVRVDVQVLRVRRGPDEQELPIEIEVAAPAGPPSPLAAAHEGRKLYFDKLIVACPLTLDVLSELFDDPSSSREGQLPLEEVQEEPSGLRSDERRIFGCVTTYTYVQNTLHAVTVDSNQCETPFKLFAPVVPVLPFDETTFGKPWVVVQVWGNQSRLLQFYTRVDPQGQRPEQTRDRIEQASHELLKLLHEDAAEAGSVPGNERLARWTTFDRWRYFHHVSAEEIGKGFFRDLDRIQGTQHTYYTGGAATFEMVEAIVRHAKYVTEKVHRALQDASFPTPRPVPFRTLSPPHAEMERLSSV